MAAMTRAHGALGARARAKTNELAAFGRTPMATRTRRVGGTTRARRRAVDARASAAVIKVIGCGGGGGNAVNRMISSGLQVGRASWRRVWRARFKRDDEAAGRGRARATTRSTNGARRRMTDGGVMFRRGRAWNSGRSTRILRRW